MNVLANELSGTDIFRTMHISCCRCPQHRNFFRVLIASTSLLLTASVGAATAVVNSDQRMCGALLGLVNDAGIVKMSDAELCNLKFASIPAAKSHGFTFPKWSHLSVADAPAMYVNMISANRSSHSVAYKPDFALAKRLAQQGAEDKNLDFFTATVPVGEWTLEGSSVMPRYAHIRDLTFVSMELQRCTKLRDIIPSPYYASFEKADLKTSIPASIDTSGSEITFWGGKPYLISVSYRWTTPGLPGPVVVVMLNNLWWSPGNDHIDSGLTGATKCSYRIEK